MQRHLLQVEARAFGSSRSIVCRQVLHAAEGTSDGLCHNAYELGARPSVMLEAMAGSSLQFPRWRVALLGLVHTGLVEPLREEAQRTSSNFMLSHDVDAFLSWKYYPLRGLEKEMLVPSAGIFPSALQRCSPKPDL